MKDSVRSTPTPKELGTTRALLGLVIREQFRLARRWLYIAIGCLLGSTFVTTIIGLIVILFRSSTLKFPFDPQIVTMLIFMTSMMNWAIATQISDHLYTEMAPAKLLGYSLMLSVALATGQVLFISLYPLLGYLAFIPVALTPFVIVSSDFKEFYLRGYIRSLNWLERHLKRFWI